MLAGNIRKDRRAIQFETFNPSPRENRDGNHSDNHGNSYARLSLFGR